jgi:hypothetical protein
LQNLNNIYRGTFVPKIKSINYWKWNNLLGSAIS